MPSKPDFQIAMPARSSSDFQRPASLPRTPKFHEDFDAPFSEAIANAPATTPPYETSSSPVQTPDQWMGDAAWPSDMRRRSGVNDKLRDWARKSIIMVRGGSDSSSEDGERPTTSKSSTKST
ncbi:hypothetical protein VHEMI10618 [[Torrubiella] hemipterigena]|uniref:Uncharacterized protein n=1 Tax=[Torrubiella] hemipterigena TaxID=1531966 RepID=A0A0A1TJ58_9HYPO|nr:hypothetical protein VHEMI10618 [[Torrubiella] hemipterigena]